MKKITGSLLMLLFSYAGNSQIIYDQTSPATIETVISNYMTDLGALIQCADEFMVPAGDTWQIDAVTVRGIRLDFGPAMDSMSVEIYSDASGQPGTILYSDVHQLGPGGVPGPQDDTIITINIPTQTLTEGMYWISVYGYTPFDSKWFWGQVTGSTVGEQALLIDDQALIGSDALNWTPLQNLGLFDPNMSFSLSGNVICCLGTEEMNTDFITVYPNPVSNVLYLTTDDSMIEQITVFSITGQRMLHFGSNSSRIDVSSLENGTYIMQVQSSNGVAVKKFVKE